MSDFTSIRDDLCSRGQSHIFEVIIDERVTGFISVAQFLFYFLSRQKSLKSQKYGNRFGTLIFDHILTDSTFHSFSLKKST